MKDKIYIKTLKIKRVPEVSKLLKNNMLDDCSADTEASTYILTFSALLLVMMNNKHNMYIVKYVYLFPKENKRRENLFSLSCLSKNILVNYNTNIISVQLIYMETLHSLSFIQYYISYII